MSKIFWGLMLGVLAMPAGAGSLGRLFFSPEQRAMLNLARDRAPTTGVEEVQPAAQSEVTLNGLVTRSDGKGSVWVNGKLEQSVNYQGTPDRNQVRIKLPEGGVKLKVGQTYSPTNGQVQESYHRFPPPPATVTPSPAAPAKPALPADTSDENLEPDAATP